jgi:hypothetical protein
MKNCKYFFVLIAISTIVVFLFLNRKSDHKQDVKLHEATPILSSNALAKSLPAGSTQGSAADSDNTIWNTNSAASKTNKWVWLAAMMRNDRYFEYKAPISFFGKVVDDDANPIGGVSVGLSWTDANEATGASSRTVISDESGFFSIEGVHGNGLTVSSLTKQGFTESLAKNSFTFHYGWFSDPYYHSPDRLNPVLFVMRKNRQGETLIVRGRQEAKLETAGQSKSFPIGNGDVIVSVQRLPDDKPNARYWNAIVTMPEGGLQITQEEFPFEAPEAGYTNQFVITNGLSVHGEQGGMFYVKTPKGYGRVMIYYVPNVPWVYAESWFNPNPGSRNLELDPAKEIKL